MRPDQTLSGWTIELSHTDSWYNDIFLLQVLVLGFSRISEKFSSIMFHVFHRNFMFIRFFLYISNMILKGLPNFLLNTELPILQRNLVWLLCCCFFDINYNTDLYSSIIPSTIRFVVCCDWILSNALFFYLGTMRHSDCQESGRWFLIMVRYESSGTVNSTGQYFPV